MYSLANKTVFVTGASSGFGAGIARKFAEHGSRLLLCARRIDRLEKFAGELRAQYKVDVHAFELDVRNRGAVHHAITGLPQQWQHISLLVNNAGLARGFSLIQEGDIEDWEEMIDTNVKGLLYVSRAVLPGMVARDEGHVINIGSTAGHQVYPKGNVYCGSKHAERAISEGMRLDLHGTNVRVTTVDPGLAETEFSLVRFHGDKERAAATYKGMQPLTPEDIADTVFYCATRPPHVNIQEVLMMPTAQASVTMVHRK